MKKKNGDSLAGKKAVVAYYSVFARDLKALARDHPHWLMVVTQIHSPRSGWGAKENHVFSSF